MANVIRIPRSVTTNTPASLAQGELAFSESGSPNGIGELFIGVAGPGVQKIATLTGAAAAEPNDSAQDNQTITTGLGIDGAEAGSSGNITISFDPNELTATAAAAADWLVFEDATDSLPKKALLSTLNLSLFNDDLGHVENATHTGDVTGDVALTIAADAVTYAKMQNVVANNVFLGNNSGAGGIVDELTGTEATALLDLATITVKGLLPTLSNVATQFLDGTGNWSTPAGGGDVSWNAGTAPADNALVRFDGVTGQLIQESAIIIDDSENVTGMGTLNGKTISALVSTTDAASAGWTFVIDDDTMATASATTLPTSESIKAYVDAVAASEMSYKGAFDPTAAAGAGSPNLNTITSATGDMYTVTVAGTYNFTTGTDPALEVGDVLIAESAGVLSDAGSWTIVQNNISLATHTTSGYVSAVAQTFGGTKTFDNVSGFDGTAVLDSFIIDGGTF